MPETYANIREILYSIIGRRVVEITQHDRDEFQQTGVAYIMLHFDTGETLLFKVGEDTGFALLDVEDFSEDAEDA